MSAPTAQFLFVAEVVVFLVSFSGAALAALRPGSLNGDRRTVGLLLVGFLASAAAGLLHGAFESSVVAPAGVVALRLAGAVVLGGGALSRWGWGSDRWPRLLLVAAAGGLAAGGALGAAGYLIGAETAVVVGSAAAGGAVALASRRSIGARLTASGAATLLITVVVLAVALTTILSNTVRNDAVRRLQSQAATLATATEGSWSSDLADAKLLAASMEGSGLAEMAASGYPPAVAPLAARLAELSTEFFSDVGLAWVNPRGVVLATSPGFDQRVGPGVAAALAHSSLVARTISTHQPGGTAGVAGGHPVAAAVYADVPAALVGEAVAVTPLDRRFLADQVRADPTLGAALLLGRTVLAAYPTGAARQPGAVLERAGTAAVPTRSSATVTTGGEFAVLTPVTGGNGTPVMEAVVATPTSVVDAARTALFRSLFLIALAGAIIAFLLSVLVTERLTRGIEELTGAARRIGRGEADVRIGLSSPDEIGVLAETFDVMSQSIGEQASALRAAAEEEATLRGRLQSVIAGMGEGLVAVDADGVITEVNGAAEGVLGRRRAQLVGHPATSALPVHLDDGRPLAEALDTARAGRRLPRALTGTVPAIGGSIPVSISAGLVTGPDGAAGSVVVLRDLRPEQELERMKREFLSRVGHELRTPLTAVIGFSQLLARRDVPAERAQAWHEEILEQSQRLLRTVEMLEFFASAGASHLGLDTEVVSSRAVVSDLAERWRTKLDGSHRLVVSPGRAAARFDADRRWLDLALDELVDNAAKFSPSGTPIAVSTVADNGTVRITVSDEGPGMSEEVLAAAFGEFVQGDSSDTRRYGGLGLGLSLVRRVAEAHGGRVECASGPGPGAHLSLVLPAARSRP